MKKPLRALVLPFLLCLSTPFAPASFAQTSIYKAPVSGPAMGTQRVALTYRAIFDIAAPVSGEVLVMIPFPADDEVQKVEKYSFGSAMMVEKLLSISLQRESTYGIRFVKISVLDPAPGDELIFEYVIARKEKSNSLDVPVPRNVLILPAEKQFLKSVVGERNDAFKTLATQIVTPNMSRDEAIKAIYQRAISPLTMATKPEALKYELSDSTALSRNAGEIARAAGIPAKFEIGITIPAGEEGEISGLRAWTNLYHPQRGWVPIDPSEGVKNKRLSEYYLGRIGSDRVTFAHAEQFRMDPDAAKVSDLPESNRRDIESIPMKMQISFKRLPASNPMVTGETKVRE